MATIYSAICPSCGHQFTQMKGILVSECGKEVPADRMDETLFSCPECGKEFRVDKKSTRVDMIALMD